MPSIDTRVQSKSLPITVEYTLRGADASVGLGEEVEWEIIAIGKRKLKRPPYWLYKLLTPRDTEMIEQSCFDDARADNLAARIDAYEDRQREAYLDYDSRR